jgi:serine/threonine protein kinase
MLHLTTIEHGLRRYIMLPYAQYGDLEVFLHGGYASKKVKKYEFDHVFKLGDRDLIISLLAECVVLADALKWLHSQISIERTSDKVFCAHMDLKPANILILPPDSKNLVGKWKISDFGISVFREDTEQHDPEYGSIGDYISQVTMNTRPKRQEGTYQAPEVKVAEKFKKASQLTPDQRGIGRKSDVWSFGCILSEILAFSQGKAEMVKEFSDARKRQNLKDDYFYIEQSASAPRYLATGDQSQNSPKIYEVRPTVLTWLEQLCERVANPQKWMYCYVSTLKKILVVDTKERPNAEQLWVLLQHVQHHIRHSLDGTQISCQVLNPKDDLEPIVPSDEERTYVPNSYKASSPPSEVDSSQSVNNQSDVSANQGDDDATLNFHFFRQTTFDEEHIDSVKLKEPRQHMETVTENELEPILSNDIDPLAVMKAPEQEPAPEDLIRPDPRPIQPVPNQPDARGRRRSSHFTSFARPAHAHGIMIERVPCLAVRAPQRISLPQPAGGNMDITAMALTKSNDGPRLACLSKSSVFIYTLKLGDFKATPEPEIPLSASSGWKDIAIAGNFLVVWGFDGRRLVSWLLGSISISFTSFCGTDRYTDLFLRYDKQTVEIILC